MRTGGGWPTSGEIDMMEDVNGLNKASQTLHDAAGSSGHPLIACQTSKCESGYNTYSVIVNRVKTGAEYLQFVMDGRVTDTITEAQVGATAWHEAIDHGFFIIFDLAMGGNYPDPYCNCTAPTTATTPGGAMSVKYVAVYEKGGNSTPPARAVTTGRVTGIDGRCLANQNSLNTEGNPIDARACVTTSGQKWSAYSDRTLRVEGGCLDVPSGGTSSGTDVDWYACNGTAAQVWTRAANGELVNPKSGLCLTDPGGSAAARLDIETCTATAAQRWSKPDRRQHRHHRDQRPGPVTTGSGAPPASFWGTTSSIPKAKKVLEVKILNRTNGRYPNSEVFWSFNGTEKSIAQQQYIDMPANSSGRMYLYLGSRNSKYFDFIEFTVGTGFINVDTTRVDRFGLKLALLVHSHTGSTRRSARTTPRSRRAGRRPSRASRRSSRRSSRGWRRSTHRTASPRPATTRRSSPAASTRPTSPRTRRPTAPRATPPPTSLAAAARCRPTPRCAPGSTATSPSSRCPSSPTRPTSTRPARPTTTRSSGTRTPSTGSSTASPTTTTPASPPTCRSQSRST